MEQKSLNKILIVKELNKFYKDFYILLDSSLLGNEFDIIKCVNTREDWTTIIKANGDEHSFAASIEWGLKEKWFVPFSHIEFTKLHVEAALKKVSENVKLKYKSKQHKEQNTGVCIDNKSILNAYPLKNIK